MKKNKVKLLVAVLVILLILAGRLFEVQALFSMEKINSNLEQLQAFVSSHLILSSLLFIAIYTAVVALALPIASVLSLGAGLIMGLEVAVFSVVIAATLGASINFLLTRYLIGEQIQLKYKDKLAKINKELDVNGRSYLLTLRLIPLFPFFLINLAAGLSNVGFKTFVWTTALGIIPGTFAYVYLGTSLKYLSDDQPGLPMPIVIALVLIGIMALLPVFYKKIKSKKEDKA